MDTTDCNDKPEVIADFVLTGPPEMLAYLYFPLWIPGSRFAIEHRLRKFLPIIDKANESEIRRGASWDYCYLTAKTLIVGPNTAGNRPGWHCDGYLTNDVNYIWADSSPTLYSNAWFDGIANDHTEAIKRFDTIAEANPQEIYDLGVNKIVRLTDKVVHHTPKVWVPGFRTFVKVTFSQHKFNLVGNTRNYDLNYDWPLHDRSLERNTESKLVDFVKP
jgi:hypothetical protein